MCFPKACQFVALTTSCTVSRQLSCYSSLVALLQQLTEWVLNVAELCKSDFGNKVFHKGIITRNNEALSCLLSATGLVLMMMVSS